MSDSSEKCDSKQPQSQVNIRFRAYEKQSGNEKGWNVLQVVQVSSSDPFNVFIFLDLHIGAVLKVFGILIGLLKQNIFYHRIQDAFVV